MNISDNERDNLNIVLGKLVEARRLLFTTAAVAYDVDLESSVDEMTGDLAEVEKTLRATLSHED